MHSLQRQSVYTTLVEVTLEKVYYSKLNFTIVNGTVSVTGIFQFTIVNFTVVNFHDYRGKNKDDPSPITIWLPKKRVSISLVYLNFVCFVDSLS